MKTQESFDRIARWWYSFEKKDKLLPFINKQLTYNRIGIPFMFLGTFIMASKGLGLLPAAWIARFNIELTILGLCTFFLGTVIYSRVIAIFALICLILMTITMISFTLIKFGL